MLCGHMVGEVSCSDLLKHQINSVDTVSAFKWDASCKHDLYKRNNEPGVTIAERAAFIMPSDNQPGQYGWTIPWELGSGPVYCSLCV
jgi:hypothetical protein